MEPIIFTIFSISVVILLIYYFFIFLRLIFYQNEKSDQVNPLPISVVVAAHDESENLKKLLPKLYAQKHPQFEIIIVEDRCNDDTYDFLLGESKLHKMLKVVNIDKKPEHISGKKYALTLGIKAAKYEQVLFTDADCFPASENWISEMSKGFIAPGTDFVLGYSPYSKTKGFLNLFIRFESFYTAIKYLSLALIKLPYMGVGRNLAYKKSLFLNKKGFSNHLHITGGDDDLFVNENSTSKNVRIVTTVDSKVFSAPKVSFKEWFIQKKRHLSVGKYYKKRHQIVLTILAIAHITFWFTFILSNPSAELYKITLGLFFVKELSMVIIFNSIRKKFKERIPVILLPVLDFLYSIYYIVFGFIGLFSKKVRWK